MAINRQFGSQLDDATLAKQYDQIRQTQGSGDARSLREAFRQGGFGDETTQGTYDPANRRMAGGTWDQSLPSGFDTVDPETKGLLGGRLGMYKTEGGQQQYGYYGDVNIFDKNAYTPWLQKNDFRFAKGPEDPGLEKAGLNLASLWKDPIFKRDNYDFTQKYGYTGDTGESYKGVSDFMKSLGYTEDLGNKGLDLAATTQLAGVGDNFTVLPGVTEPFKDWTLGKTSIPDFLKRLGYNDYTDSQYKEFAALVEGQNFAKTGGRDWWTGDTNKFNLTAAPSLADALRPYWFNQVQDSDIANPAYADYWNARGAEYADPNIFNTPEPEKTLKGAKYRYNEYGSRAEAEAQAQKEFDQLMADRNLASNALIDFRSGSTPGSFEFSKAGEIPNFSDGSPASFMFGSGSTKEQTRGKLGWNGINETVSDPELLRTILGAQGLNYDNQKLADIFSDIQDPTTRSWNDYNKNTERKFLGKTTKEQWDVGNSLAGLNANIGNLSRLSDGRLATPSLEGSTIQGIGDYNRDYGQRTTNQLSGLGKIVSAAVNYFGGAMGAPVAAAINGWGAVDRGFRDNNGQITNFKTKANPLSIYGSAIGPVAEGAGLTQEIGSTLGGQELAKEFGRAAIQGATGAASTGLQGGSFGDALKSGLISGGVGLAGTLGGDIAGQNLREIFSDTGKLGDAVSRAGSAGIRSLINNYGKAALSGNPMTKGMGLSSLLSAMGAGGAGALADDSREFGRYNTVAQSLANMGVGLFNNNEREKVNAQQEKLSQAKLNQMVAKLQKQRSIV